MGSQHGHIDRDSQLFVNFLIPAIYFDWAKGNVRVHQLSILEQVLESDNEFLKGICVFEFNGSFNDS